VKAEIDLAVFTAEGTDVGDHVRISLHGGFAMWADVGRLSICARYKKHTGGEIPLRRSGSSGCCSASRPVRPQQSPCQYFRVKRIKGRVGMQTLERSSLHPVKRMQGSRRRVLERYSGRAGQSSTLDLRAQIVLRRCWTHCWLGVAVRLVFRMNGLVRVLTAQACLCLSSPAAHGSSVWHTGDKHLRRAESASQGPVCLLALS
jgi:hypothetical protein